MVDLVGSRVELRRAGANRYEGLCPFHEERTPSFGINPAEKLFYCFGCGEGGDGFKFVQLTEGLDFKGALEHLADRYGVQLEVVAEDPAAAERRRERDRLLELLERTAAFYVRYLWESSEASGARDYLLGRGLDEDVLRAFRVGYAPSAWDKVLLASRRGGFSDRELVAAGLAQRARGEGRTYDRFRRRIMFPLCDARGRVLGFGARAVGADQTPKYLNSSDNAIFRKGRHLFGADIARAPAAKASTVIVAEGYTDVIALHQAGLRNTVGLMGTALTDEQVGELARLAPTVQLALDADSAGHEAMLRAARVAAHRQLTLRVVPLPVGSDPADLVAAEGPDAVRRRVEASVPFIRFRVERELELADLADAEGKDRLIDALRPVFSDIAVGAMRDELVGLVADRTNLPPARIGSWLEQAPAPSAAAAAPAARRVSQLDPAARAERAFLAQCIALPAGGRTALQELDIEASFTSDLLRRAATYLRDHVDAPSVHLATGDDELAALVAELSVSATNLPASTAALEGERIGLDVQRLKREIGTMRGSGDVATRVARLQELEARRDAAIERSMRETATAR